MLKRFAVILLAMLFVCTAAFAETDATLKLPNKLRLIGDGAFQGNWSLETVILPDTVQSIGSRAFADSTLQTIRIPGNCTIAADAFADCGKLTVDTVSGSKAAFFATANIPMNVRTYAAGSYEVGDTIPANVYIIRAKSGKATVTLRGGELSGTISRSFTGNLILEIRSGEQLTMTNCTAVVDYEFDQSLHLSAGLDQSMLRVGVDVDAGEYDLLLTGTTGTVTWYEDYRMTESASLTVDADFVEQGEKLTLNDGEVVFFDGVRLPKADGVTTYRALLIGQDYEGTNMELNAPWVDTQNVASMLGTLDGTDYKVTTAHNKTVAEILQLVHSVFASADDDDVCLFYYSGHGAYGGCLIGVDGFRLDPATLREQMDKVQGTKILIVDACYSGALVTPTDEEESEEDDADVFYAKSAALTADAGDAGSFVSSFTSAFKPALLSRSAGLFNEESYYVLAACAPLEEAFERRAYSDGAYHYFGIFSYYLNRGCGWNELTGKKMDTLYADTDSDDRLTMSELYAYAKQNVANAVKSSGYTQTVTAYPSASDFVLFAK